MDSAFERALLKIPPQLRERPGVRFTVILNGNKKPEGKDWTGINGANYAIDDPQLAGYLSQGHNYGILCGHSGIVVPDLDDPTTLEGMGIMGKVPPTFQIQTGRGGHHLYFDCPELDHQIGLYHPTLKDDDGEPLHLGEIQSLGQQVVGPGSTHPNGNHYEVINDAPIMTISKADLLKIFDGLILMGIDDPAEEPRRSSERRRRSGGSSLGDLINIDAVVWPKAIAERAGAEVRGSHPLHGSESGKNFAVNTVKNCWHCFRHNSGGGPLEWLAVGAGVISCKEAKPGCLDDKVLFKKVLQIARDRGFDIPSPSPAQQKAKERPEGPTVLDALQKLIDNEDKIKGDCTWEWRLQRRRIENALRTGHISQASEKKAHKFLRKFKTILGELGIDYNDLHPLLLKPKGSKEEFSDEIKAKALDVLENGDPVQYVADSCSEMVVGAEKAFKKLISCVSSQNVTQSSGLHPKLSGESSGGKTFTVLTFAHHLPKEAVVVGSMSAKAGFYHKDGDRILRVLDDYQAGNDDLDTVIKQTSSKFHDTYQHRTVIKQTPAVMEIGREQTWAITSVDSSQEIQVLNRQLPINVDDSVETTEKVNKLTIERYCKGESQFPVKESILVSRCIMQTLRDADYITVGIPFGDRIEWLDTSNRRNPSIFMDLVVAHTAMLRYQREVDAEGHYLATEEDFTAAKDLFTDNDGEELVKRLTKKERETLEFLVSRPDGISQDDLAEHLKVSRQRAGQILFGRDKDHSGLMQKVPMKETRMSVMTRLSDDTNQTVHKTIYSLKDYERFAGFEGVVRLKPLSENPGNPCKPDASTNASMTTASGKTHASMESKNEKESIDREYSQDCTNSGKDIISQKTAKNACTSSHDNDIDACTMLAEGLHESLTLVRFKTDYQTDFDGKMCDLHPGDVVSVSPYRAQVWINRGVAEAVDG